MGNFWPVGWTEIIFKVGSCRGRLVAVSASASASGSVVVVAVLVRRRRTPARITFPAVVLWIRRLAVVVVTSAASVAWTGVSKLISTTAVDVEDLLGKVTASENWASLCLSENVRRSLWRW